MTEKSCFGWLSLPVGRTRLREVRHLAGCRDPIKLLCTNQESEASTHGTHHDRNEHLGWMCIGIRRQTKKTESVTYWFTTERDVDKVRMGPISGVFYVCKNYEVIALGVPMPGNNERRALIRAAQKFSAIGRG